MKKSIILLTTTLLASSYLSAENYPDLMFVGQSASAVNFAVMEQVTTDGKGDVITQLKIFSKDKTPSFQATTQSECLNRSCEQLAQKEILTAFKTRLDNAKITKNNQPRVLFEKEKIINGNFNYKSETDFLYAVADKAYYRFTISTNKETKWAHLKFENWDTREIEQFNAVDQELQDAYIDSVSLEKVYRIISLDRGPVKSRLLIVTSYRTQGFEGPDTHYVYNVVELR
jgi:hypothetical protein